MIKQIQDLHAQKDSLEKRIAEAKNKMSDPEMLLTVYFRENQELRKMEYDLESVIKQLTDLATL